MQTDLKSFALISSTVLGLPLATSAPATPKAEEPKSKHAETLPPGTEDEVQEDDSLAFERFIDILMSERRPKRPPGEGQPTCGGVCAVQ